MSGLEALKKANFDWVMRLDDVWRDLPHDVPAINAAIKSAILERCRSMAGASPLGWILLGPAGAGKTHLLGSLRRESEDAGAMFIMVDMTDVHDFWETLLLGFLSSMREPEDQPQCRRLLGDLLAFLGLTREKATRYARSLAEVSGDTLVRNTNRIVQTLGRKERPKTIEHQDVLRALLMLNSEDFRLGNMGYTWLQGLGLEPEESREVGIRKTRMEPIRIVRGLSWLMSLRGPTILALDQLDAIVAEKHVSGGDGPAADEQAAAQAIIEGIGRGLSALADHTTRTLCLVSCLESTWEILRQTALRSSTDRFEAPRTLRPLLEPQSIFDLVSNRLAPAFQSTGFRPAYPTWPFNPRLLEHAAGLTPREVLKRCAAHRLRCLEDGRVEELVSFDTVDLSGRPKEAGEMFRQIDNAFESLKNRAYSPGMLSEEYEDDLGHLLQAACRSLIREIPLPEETDVILETRFGGGRSYSPLHARLRLVNVAQGAEETHICFRVLQKSNPNAYLARINAAVTASGIDRRISFRRLFLLRSHPFPRGPKSREATASLKKMGGRFLDLNEDQIRTLWALQVMDQKPPPHFEDWLRYRRPATGMTIFKEALPEYCGPGAEAGRWAEPAYPPESVAAVPGDGRAASEAVEAGPMEEPVLPLGLSLDDRRSRRVVTLPLKALARHCVVMAGSGAGKTVLVRRVLEEAALRGVPSVVIDTSGELVRLGETWPEPPEQWWAGDANLARAFHERTDVVVWTPGRASGRPLSLPLLPDFDSLSRQSPDFADALERMTLMAASNLEELAAPGRSGKAKKKKGVLAAALRYFAGIGGGDLADFIRLLVDLPREAGGQIRAAPKLAAEMADLLRARLNSDPFQPEGASVQDAGELFFAGPQSRRTRISVVNLTGLPGLEMQQEFVGRLATALYTWIKRHAGHGPSGLTGLLVIDEARDFIPPVQSPPSKAGLMQLASQGRKYGLGLILSAQNPKTVDYNALGQFSTWIFGRVNAPQSIKQVKKMLEEKGGAARDVAKLDTGRFYVTSNRLFVPPAKIEAPMCLSHHPDEPLTEDDILLRARAGIPARHDSA